MISDFRELTGSMATLQYQAHGLFAYIRNIYCKLKRHTCLYKCTLKLTEPNFLCQLHVKKSTVCVAYLLIHLILFSSPTGMSEYQPACRVQFLAVCRSGAEFVVLGLNASSVLLSHFLYLGMSLNSFISKSNSGNTVKVFHSNLFLKVT